jgi:hypothetical protein
MFIVDMLGVDRGACLVQEFGKVTTLPEVVC